MGRLSAKQRIFIFLAVLLLPHPLMAETLNIGSTSDTPAQEIDAFLPLVTYLGKELHAEGIKLMHIDDPSSALARGKFGYTFTGAEENTMLWVLRGKVGAGVIDDQIYANLAGKNLDQLRIIHRTFSIPRHIVSHRADLPPRLVTRIKDILIRMQISADIRR